MSFHKIDTNKQIIVIGDSHTRSFGLSDYFLPIFMGIGNVNNFTTDPFAQSTEETILRIMSHFKRDDNFMIVLGEPDCRWNTYKKWFPPLLVKNPVNKIIDSVSRFKRAMLKIKKLYNNLILYSANPHLRSDQNETTLLWNKEVSVFSKANNILFCDIYNEVLNDLNSFLIDEIDEIHLNESIQELVLRRLKFTEKPKKIITPSDSFVFDKRFRCYSLNKN